MEPRPSQETGALARQPITGAPVEPPIQTMYPLTIPSPHDFIPAISGFANRTFESDTMAWTGQLPSAALVYLTPSIIPSNAEKTVGFLDGRME